MATELGIQLEWFPMHEHDGLWHGHHRQNDGHGSHEGLPMMTREEAEMTWNDREKWTDHHASELRGED